MTIKGAPWCNIPAKAHKRHLHLLFLHDSRQLKQRKDVYCTWQNINLKKPQQKEQQNVTER